MLSCEIHIPVATSEAFPTEVAKPVNRAKLSGVHKVAVCFTVSSQSERAKAVSRALIRSQDTIIGSLHLRIRIHDLVNTLFRCMPGI